MPSDSPSCRTSDCHRTADAVVEVLDGMAGEIPVCDDHRETFDLGADHLSVRSIDDGSLRSDGGETPGHSTSDSERSLEVEDEDGPYLLSVESAYEGYVVKSGVDRVLVPNVTVNGRYIGTSDYFETECDDFEITVDGEFNLRYHETETDRSGGRP